MSEDDWGWSSDDVVYLRELASAEEKSEAAHYPSSTGMDPERVRRIADELERLRANLTHDTRQVPRTAGAMTTRIFHPVDGWAAYEKALSRVSAAYERGEIERWECGSHVDGPFVAVPESSVHLLADPADEV